MKTLVAAYGRMNPPHIGHMELIDEVISIADKHNATPAVFVSHSENNGKNPLPYDMKVRLLSRWTDGVVKIDYDNEIKQPMNILHYASKNLFDRVYLVCGRDRYEEYKRTFIGFANSREYFKFQDVDVIERNCIVDDQVSGTLMRKLAKDNNWNLFESYCFSNASLKEKQIIWNHLRG